MQRLRLYDCRNSRLPTVIGSCKEDVFTISNYVNSAQRRLLMAKEAGGDGWWGTWAEMVFNVSQTDPYLTTPRNVARLEAADICEEPVEIQNQFYEYLNFGNGRLPKNFVQSCPPGLTQIYTRNTVPLFKDLPNAPQSVKVYLTNSSDENKRVLLQGSDSNSKTIYTQDGLNRVTGIFLTMLSPAVTSPVTFSTITGIQKDVTQGEVQFYSVDPVTADETLLLIMEPTETTASYRRYYFDELPLNCCSTASTATTLQITAIAKLDLIPVITDTDYCLIQNLEAIIEECQSIRYSEIDGEESKRLSRERHNAAIGFLNGELAHYLDPDKPSITFAPFGTARLERKRIGVMT